jgi:hypothetical protein
MPLDGTLRISFYEGDPTLQTPLATRLDTQSVFLSDMGLGDTLTTTAYLKSPGHAFDLYIAINDDGSTLPLDIFAQSGHLIECDYDNVSKVHISPDPVSLHPELIRDNLKCLAAPGVPTTPDNGAVKAYILMDDGRHSTSFTFYWSIGTTAKPLASADHVGPAYTGLGSGAYTVYAVHKDINCSSDTATVVIGEVSAGVEARVLIEQDFDNDQEPNGELSVVVNDADNDGVGDPEGNFDYAWYGGQDILVDDTLGTTYTLTGLGAGTYSVLVSDKTTGCYDSAYATIGKNILGEGEDAGIAGISMYPNPGTERFTVLIDNGYVGDVQIQLQSAVGNEVDQTFSSHKGTQTINVFVPTAELTPGVYLVKISLDKGTVHRKWIKF